LLQGNLNHISARSSHHAPHARAGYGDPDERAVRASALRPNTPALFFDFFLETSGEPMRGCICVEVRTARQTHGRGWAGQWRGSLSASRIYAACETSPGWRAGAHIRQISERPPSYHRGLSQLLILFWTHSRSRLCFPMARTNAKHDVSFHRHFSV